MSFGIMVVSICHGALCLSSEVSGIQTSSLTFPHFCTLRARKDLLTHHYANEHLFEVLDQNFDCKVPNYNVDHFWQPTRKMDCQMWVGQHYPEWVHRKY